MASSGVTLQRYIFSSYYPNSPVQAGKITYFYFEILTIFN